MNSAHLHLVVNHAPLFGLLFGVFLMGYGWLKRSLVAMRWAAGLLLLTALLGVISMQSGEGAEDLVENLAGVTHDAIESHENAAKISAILIWITAGLAAAGQVLERYRKKGAARLLALLAIGAGVFAIGAVVSASNLGGKIRHSEIQE